MRLDDALAGVELLRRVGENVSVAYVQYDSRKVKPGDIFVAMQGGSSDGNSFIASALALGASAIVTDSSAAYRRWTTGAGRHPMALVANGRRALAGAAANLLDHPEQKLKLSAVTGTNGKTTTAWLLEQMLRSVGRKCVLVGTIETHVGDEVRTSEHTTPEASDLLRLFADGVAAGATEAVMEMSSHALAQERVWGLPMDVAMFTNLTQDHLDYHGTMENYLRAKQRIFLGVGTEPPRRAVINLDDPSGAQMLRTACLNDADCSEAEVLTYSIGDSSAYWAGKIRYQPSGTDYVWHTPFGTFDVASPLCGKVNVYNLLAASCAALARGLTPAEIVKAARDLRQVPGRFETVPNSRGLHVVVDFAHTDDALRNLTRLARDLVAFGGGRVITLFGCGGDRDKTKRPRMGRAAGEGSDLVVLTSDNPRNEDPDSILEQALAGVRESPAKYIVEADRAAAIRIAIEAARPGDIVLLAGKGHEKLQILGTGTVPFSDAAVAAAVLQEMQ